MSLGNELSGTAAPSGQALAEIHAGGCVRVVGYCGGAGFQQRMTSMGLAPGVCLRVLKGGRGSFGPWLIAVGEVRLAIGQGMARKILVEVCG